MLDIGIDEVLKSLCPSSQPSPQGEEGHCVLANVQKI